MRRQTLLIVTVGLLLVASARGDDAKKELEKYLGTWTTASLEVDGQSLREDAIKELKFVFKGDEAKTQGNPGLEKVYTKLKFKVDPGSNPKTVDITVTEGDAKGDVIEGIYQLEKDELKICAKLGSKERPTEFASKPGTNLVLIVLKRDK